MLRLSTCLALTFSLWTGLPVSSAASLSPIKSQICASDSRQVVKSDNDIWPYQKYQSSNATPPYMQINATGAPLASGFIFFGQEQAGAEEGVKQTSPFIMTDNNELVWSGPIESSSSNFRRQILYGESIITFWIGTGQAASAGLAGLGYGEVQFYDNTYQHIQTICLQLNLTLPDGVHSECDADVHESYITERNTILLTAYNVTRADATSVGGPADAWVYDPLAVEVDIKTGDVLFVWSPLAHVPINATHYPVDGSGMNSSQPFDWFHMNSIQLHNGNYLINARHTWTTYYVNPKGDIIWQIDGATGGSFGSLPENGLFSWEHETRLHTISSTQSILTLFANDNDVASGTSHSNGVSLLLTLPPNPKYPPQVLTTMWDQVNPVAAYAEGSFAQLDNDNYFAGYGIRPYIKEFGPGNKPDGEVRWSAQFAQSDLGQSYRAYKQEWHATPATSPSLVVLRTPSSGDELSSCAGPDTRRGYVSWNGATDVTSYVVCAGSSEGTLKEIGRFAKKGFETKFSIPSNAKTVQVGAIEREGNVVRSSDIVKVSD